MNQNNTRQQHFTLSTISCWAVVAPILLTLLLVVWNCNALEPNQKIENYNSRWKSKQIESYDYENGQVHDQALNDFLNRHSKGSWHAGNNKVFTAKTIRDVMMRRRGMKKRETTTKPKATTIENKNSFNTTLPATYSLLTDYRYINCKQLSLIRDEEQCGCWAFSVAEVVSDRFCIASNTRVNHILSPQFMISCDVNNGGCSYGYFDTAFKFAEKYGIVTESCFPFVSGGGNAVPSCPRYCQNGSLLKTFKVNNSRLFDQNDTEGMQLSILNGGSLSASHDVYRDFLQYKGGVYRHIAGSYMFTHSVRIVGWGITTPSEGSIPFLNIMLMMRIQPSSSSSSSPTTEECLNHLPIPTANIHRHQENTIVKVEEEEDRLSETITIRNQLDDEQCLFHMLILTSPRMEIEGSRYHYLKSTLEGLYSELHNTIFRPCITVFNPNPTLWSKELEESIPTHIKQWKQFRILENQFMSSVFASPSMAQRKKNQSNNFLDMMKTYMNVSSNLDRNHVVFMEDDFVMCKDVSSHLVHVLNMASNSDLFSAIRFSFGLNGVLVQRRDIPHMIHMCEEYAFKDYPIDNLLEEFLNRKNKMGKDHFKSREVYTYRYQLMEHIGKVSSVGNDRNQESMELTFPHCYETQYFSQIMNQFKMYCAHSLFSPCHRPKKLQFSHDIYEFPLNSPTFKIPLVEFNRVESVLCEEGENCDACCKKREKTCDPTFFPFINHCGEMQKHVNGKCTCKIEEKFWESVAPYISGGDCIVGYRPSRFNCTNQEEGQQRLCPCKATTATN